MTQTFNPTEIVRPLRQYELLALLKATHAELVKLTRDALEKDSLCRLEDAIAEYAVTVEAYEPESRAYRAAEQRYKKSREWVA